MTKFWGTNRHFSCRCRNTLVDCHWYKHNALMVFLICTETLFHLWDKCIWLFWWIWWRWRRGKSSQSSGQVHEKGWHHQTSILQKKKLEGNKCQKFIKEKNLKILEEMLLAENIPEDKVYKVIQTFKALREVYRICCCTILDPNHRLFTRNFKRCWQNLYEDAEINITWTPKVHQITDHLSHYFKDPLVGGQAQWVTSDQITEHVN